MPFDVAVGNGLVRGRFKKEERGYVPMEQPDTGVVGAEAQDNVAVGAHEDGITAHGGGGWRGGVVWVVGAGFIFTAGYHLEGVAMEMEGVSGVRLADDQWKQMRSVRRTFQGRCCSRRFQ